MSATTEVRRLYDHETTPLNRNHIVVEVLDGPGPGNASHEYEVIVFAKPKEERVSCDDSAAVARLRLSFQNGPVKEAGANGITDEALYAVLLDRLRGFQSGPYACRENAVALTHLETALMWLHKRTLDRERRGVEGTHQK